jgi:hypothetical protein
MPTLKSTLVIPPESVLEERLPKTNRQIGRDAPTARRGCPVKPTTSQGPDQVNVLLLASKRQAMDSGTM